MTGDFQLAVFAVLVDILLARTLEAYRDAEAFELPNEPRSFTWHFLKYLQYSLLFFSGYFSACIAFFESYLVAMVVVIGWLMPMKVYFDWVLKKFRNRYRCERCGFLKTDHVNISEYGCRVRDPKTGFVIEEY